MDAVKEFLLSPAGLGYIAMALILLGVILKSVMPKKVGMIEKIEGIAFRAFNFAEKAIPDDLAGVGKMGKALRKADTFLKEFVKKYQERYGIAPTNEEKHLAVDLAEKLVYTQNAKK